MKLKGGKIYASCDLKLKSMVGALLTVLCLDLLDKESWVIHFAIIQLSVKF